MTAEAEALLKFGALKTKDTTELVDTAAVGSAMLRRVTDTALHMRVHTCRWLPLTSISQRLSASHASPSTSSFPASNASRSCRSSFSSSTSQNASR